MKPVKASDIPLGADLTEEQQRSRAAAMAVRQRKAKREALKLMGVIKPGVGSTDLHERLTANTEQASQQRMKAWRESRSQ